MALIKKNIWLAFYFILALWSVISAIAAYMSYQDSYEDITQSQVNLTRLTAHAFKSSLTQYQTIIDIVGSELSRLDFEHDLDHINAVLDDTTGIEKTILALALFDVEGYPLTSSPRMVDGHTNYLRDNPETKLTFEKTLASDEAVIGRTYFHKDIGELIIPFRKAIRDEKGVPKFVLSISISLKGGFEYFLTNKTKMEIHSFDTFLFRENDRYFQIAPMERIYDPQVYLYQLPQEEIDRSIKRLEVMTGMTFEEIKQSNDVYINELASPSRQSYAASTYINKYDLWITTEVKKSVIMARFVEKLPNLIALYVVAVSVMFFLFRNIALSEQRKQQELAHQANHDYLTGIANRYSLERYLSGLDKHARYSLLCINVDSFKLVNDNFGNPAGDAVLKNIANRLVASVGEKHAVFRSGSDEFVVVAHTLDREALDATIDLCRSCFTQAFLYRDYEIVLSCSISVASSGQDDVDAEAVKRNAELAMSHAKQTRNGIVFYQPRFLTEHLDKSKIELELKRAIERDEIYMMYQPQFTSSKTLKGVEALVRWEHPELGFVPPDKFIPVAENCGYMNELGEFIVRRTLAELSELFEALQVELDVAINVSVKQFQSMQFIPMLEQAIEERRFNKQRLIVEITESVLADDFERICALLNVLKAEQIRVSLDDFGTGYSSLSVLKHFPIDEVKIDKSFVSDMLVSESSYSMLAGVLGMVQKLGMETVAEGIESEEEAGVLRRLGCDVFQGYYFARPMKLEALRRFILDNR